MLICIHVIYVYGYTYIYVSEKKECEGQKIKSQTTDEYPFFFEVFDARWMPGVSYYSRFQDVFFFKMSVYSI